jgi:hypothetical protein
MALRNWRTILKRVDASATFWKLTSSAVSHAAMSFFSPLINVWMLIAMEPRAGHSTGKRVEPAFQKS